MRRAASSSSRTTTCAALGVDAHVDADVKPVEVPRLPADERVTIEDPSSPAPGADAFRWFFYASNPPWSNTRHSLSNVRALQKEFLDQAAERLFVLRHLREHRRRRPARREERRRSRARSLDLERARAHGAAASTRRARRLRRLQGDAAPHRLRRRAVELVRPPEPRPLLARGLGADDKVAAHETLYEVLVTTSKLIAPFVPYSAEAMYQNLVVGLARAHGERQSVHLERLPERPTPARDRTRRSRAKMARDPRRRERRAQGANASTSSRSASRCAARTSSLNDARSVEALGPKQR